jgi:hypothetical protein
MILNFLLASTHQISSDLNFSVTEILICYCCSQKFEIRYIFEGCVSYFYIMILYLRNTSNFNLNTNNKIKYTLKINATNIV